MVTRTKIFLLKNLMKMVGSSPLSYVAYANAGTISPKITTVFVNAAPSSSELYGKGIYLLLLVY